MTILDGAGCAEARSEVFALAQALQTPIVHSLAGKHFLQYDNPFDVGRRTGLLSFSSGYRAMGERDILLMLGTDFPYHECYPRHPGLIEVDLRADHIGRRVRVDVALVNTVSDTAVA